MTDGSTREGITRLTLLVPGKPASLEAWRTALATWGLQLTEGLLQVDGRTIGVEWADNDGSLGEAFGFGTVEADVVTAIDAAPGALVLQCPMDLKHDREQVVSLVRALHDAGALCVRVEESKMGWQIADWLESIGSDDPWAWHRAVVMFLRGEQVMQSCGMHAFSLPDVRVEIDEDPEALQELATILNVYQLAEDPALLSGETFSPDGESPHRVVERWPDTEYPPGHVCHNPYGVWRLGPPGGTAREGTGRGITFMPALSVVLLALESKSSAPLTKEQVEAARDRAACIVMEPKDAQRLEHSRGYADLNPEFAWEQWQLIRSGLSQS